MKKNIGSQLALYPTPVTVIGAMDGEKPTWTLAAHVGIIGHDRILVSLAALHFINHCIRENQKLSVNIVNEDFLPEADYSGSVSGAKEDFICTVDNTYVEEAHLDEAGKINYRTLKPVLSEFPTYEYLRTGEVIAPCLSYAKARKKGEK